MSSKFFRGAPLLAGNNTVPGQTLTLEEKKLFSQTLDACKNYGLDFFPTVIEKLSYDEMSEVAAYGGFPRRFPHWSFGMQYEELQRGYEFGLQKIYEMVLNTDPCYIYILASNSLVDNITVVAHATGHNDFFKNNIHFSQTCRGMMNKMGNHGSRIRKYMDRWGRERVTEFIDHVMRIQTLIDPAKAWETKEIAEPVYRDSRQYEFPRRLPVDKDHLYMDPWINTKDFRDKENQRIGKQEIAAELGITQAMEKDIFCYIKDHAPLKPWQADIVSILYEEAMYFAPQRATKTLNEGHACLLPDMSLFTNAGLVTVGEVVDKKLEVIVNDGTSEQKVVGWFKFLDRPVVKITTSRGLVLGGSNNHRIIDGGGQWKELGDFKVGDRVQIGKGMNLWPKDLVKTNYECKRRVRMGVLFEKYGITPYQAFRHLYGHQTAFTNQVTLARVDYDKSLVEFGGITQDARRNVCTIPGIVDVRLATILGYLVGDGHISDIGRSIGLTTGDEEQADNFVTLMTQIFGVGVPIRKRWDDTSKKGRWRLSLSSKDLRDFLVHLGLKTGVSARRKTIPDCILRSPKEVMTAYLRAYFDCDGYAGKAGVILSTASETMGQQVQVILLNYGILSHRILCDKDIWQIQIRGKAASVYYEQIGFGLTRKQQRLKDYVENRRWFVKEKTEDEIVSIEYSRADVYDITVENTHRYTAQGFVNHNSKIDYQIMAKQGFVGLGQKTHDAGIFQYAIHKMGVLGGKYSMNPYKLGYYLLEDIEERYDKGQFGTEWENCKDMHEKENWDKKVGKGKEKIFEVRKFYDDVTFLHEFFTQEFCDKFEFYEWKHYPNGEYRIENRDAKKIKKKLVASKLNGGLPDIQLADANHRNRGWLLLQHMNQDDLLFEPYARETLCSLHYLWGKEVVLATHDRNGEEVVFICAGQDAEKEVVLVSRSEYERKW